MEEERKGFPGHDMARSFVSTFEMAESAAPAEDSEARLVRQSLAGDTDAFAALVRAHERRVFRLLGRFFRRPEEVEDAAQETFLRAWRKLSTYRAEAPFEHWITRIALRSAYDRLRRHGFPTEPLDEDLEAAAPAADPTARLEVERLLARLSPADRFVLTLLEGEGWSVAEIAEKLGWTAVNVKVRAHRARKRLRKVLEEGGA
ncbi:MAG: polymerase sigma-70 factor, subfamily [Acidobacteriota bacterium]|jgi:RNA polymerase sigma-70 factor (ECF subfamily)|nr:polymerase sigma-70 factor, subfamily [Acidobacteriota bacterium]